jgi:hypothetical protein
VIAFFLISEIRSCSITVSFEPSFVTRGLERLPTLYEGQQTIILRSLSYNKTTKASLDVWNTYMETLPETDIQT